MQNLLKKTGMTEEEQKQAVARYLEEAEEMKERYNDMQRHSQAVLAAKLAARRRHKEEMRKEAAMKKELNAMSKKQVGYKQRNQPIKTKRRNVQPVASAGKRANVTSCKRGKSVRKPRRDWH